MIAHSTACVKGAAGSCEPDRSALGWEAMTVTEICLVLMAAALVALAVAGVIAVVRLLPLLRKLDGLTDSMTETTRRFDDLLEETSAIVRDAGRLERRAGDLVHTVLDSFEPTVRAVASVASGLRAALSVFLGGGERERPSVTEPSREAPRFDPPREP